MASGACCSHSARKVVTGIGHRLRALAEFALRRAGVAFDRGREPVKILDQIIGRLAGLFADQRLDADIARPHRLAQLREPGIGLDRDAAPAAQIERKRDVVVDRMAGADVDVEAAGLLAERAQQVHVLVALGVGDELVRIAPKNYLSSPYSECSVRTASSV